LGGGVINTRAAFRFIAEGDASQSPRQRHERPSRPRYKGALPVTKPADGDWIRWPCGQAAQLSEFVHNQGRLLIISHRNL